MDTEELRSDKVRWLLLSKPSTAIPSLPLCAPGPMLSGS